MEDIMNNNVHDHPINEINITVKDNEFQGLAIKKRHNLT